MGPADVTFYHYTCEHGLRGIGERGLVLPLAAHSPTAYATLAAGPHAWMGDWAWFTDLDTADPQSLGLTSEILGLRCDRLAHRYRVGDGDRLRRWVTLMRQIAPAVDIEDLHLRPGVLPMHWWIADTPVPVALDAAYRRPAVPAGLGARHPDGTVPGGQGRTPARPA